MLLADTMAIFFVVIGFLIAFPSLWLLCSGLWPGFIDETSKAVQNGVIKSFLIGIPITALSVVAIGVVGKLPASFGQIGGILTFSALLFYAEAGVAGLARVLGKRLFALESSQDNWRAVIKGGAVLVLSYLLPLLGWFLILPASLIIGAGSSTRAVCGLVKRKLSSAKKGKKASEKETSKSNSPVSQIASASLSQLVAEDPVFASEITEPSPETLNRS